MDELGMNRIEKRFPPIVADLAHWNPIVRDEFTVASGVTGVLSTEDGPPFRGFRFSTTPLANQAEGTPTEIYGRCKGSATEKGLVDDNDDAVQDLIFSMRSTATISDSQGIADRLLELYNSSKEEEPSLIGMAVQSLLSYYKFLQKNPDLKRPAITLTPDGNVYVSWRGDEGRVLSIHFLPDSDVRFVVFKPNRRDPERKTRISGMTTFDMLMEEVAPCHVCDWISK